MWGGVRVLPRALQAARVGKPPKEEAAGLWRWAMGKALACDAKVAAVDGGSKGGLRRNHSSGRLYGRLLESSREVSDGRTQG